MTADHGVVSDVRSVTDQNQVIEFGATADTGFANGGAVHAGVGLNLDVIFEDGGARLGHLVPTTVFLFGVAEAVGADNDAVL